MCVTPCILVVGFALGCTMSVQELFRGGLSGILLTRYCPDPALFDSREAWEAASVHAHYIWYYFAAIGLVAAVALLPAYAASTRGLKTATR